MTPAAIQRQILRQGHRAVEVLGGRLRLVAMEVDKADDGLAGDLHLHVLVALGQIAVPIRPQDPGCSGLAPQCLFELPGVKLARRQADVHSGALHLALPRRPQGQHP
jgi:hypothetical protein